MRIITSKGYIYNSSGYDVHVGDTVILPPPDFRRIPWYDTVAAVGVRSCAYTGFVKDILGIHRRAFGVVGVDDASILALIQNAENLTIDGTTYVKETRWVRQ